MNNTELLNQLKQFKYNVEFDAIKASIQISIRKENDKIKMIIWYSRNRKASWVGGNGSAQLLEVFHKEEAKLISSFNEKKISFDRVMEDPFSEFTIRYTFNLS